MFNTVTILAARAVAKKAMKKPAARIVKKSAATFSTKAKIAKAKVAKKGTISKKGLAASKKVSIVAKKRTVAAAPKKKVTASKQLNKKKKSTAATIKSAAKKKRIVKNKDSAVSVVTDAASATVTTAAIIEIAALAATEEKVTATVVEELSVASVPAVDLDQVDEMAATETEAATPVAAEPIDEVAATNTEAVTSVTNDVAAVENVTQEAEKEAVESLPVTEEAVATPPASTVEEQSAESFSVPVNDLFKSSSVSIAAFTSNNSVVDVPLVNLPSASIPVSSDFSSETFFL